MASNWGQDTGGFGACHRCDATKGAAQIAVCGHQDCPFAKPQAPTFADKPITEMCLYSLADGRTLVQDRFAQLPSHTFPDEATARVFALGYLYGLNPRALPEELRVQKINN